jgi:predicted DsbA family dithiol-disulfide isomerase
MPETVRVYFDYLCPYAWRGAEVADVVGRNRSVLFDWQHFSLLQAQRQGNGWQLWNERVDPDDEYGSNGLLPFLASCAVRRQGAEKHGAFLLALLRARHRDRRPFTRITIFEVAEEVGLHMPCFESDLADPESRTRLAHEHHRAAALDVFGTPTFQFPTGHLAYMRIRELPGDSSEALRLFDDYRRLLEEYPYLETVRRPRPKGN